MLTDEVVVDFHVLANEVSGSNKMSISNVCLPCIILPTAESSLIPLLIAQTIYVG